MPRRPTAFRQVDLQRALRAARSAGVEIERIEIEPETGKIVIISRSAEPAESMNPLDTGWHEMRVRLKGINRSVKRLADGKTVTYWYAWRGGPRLQGEPGTPEFIASYNHAVAAKIEAPKGSLLSLLRGYQASSAFTDLQLRTREDYLRNIRQIEKAFGDFPLAALTDPRTRGVFLAWRDRLGKSSRRQADHSWAVLARVLSWGVDRGLVTHNPCTKAGVFIGVRAPIKFGRWRRGPLPRWRTGAAASATTACFMDGSAPGRPAATPMERVRWHAHPLAPVEAWHARRHPGRRTPSRPHWTPPQRRSRVRSSSSTQMATPGQRRGSNQHGRGPAPRLAS